jgi:hypothetical protein
MILTPQQIYETMWHAGMLYAAQHLIAVVRIPPVAVSFTAIALRESAGDPGAWNFDDKTKDKSYGLLQINMFGGLAERLALFGLTNETDLLNPDTNAHAGFVLWAGKNSNLDLAWYIGGTHGGTYQARYEAHLPAAMAAALASALGV